MVEAENVILQADAERLPLADGSMDLVFGSPPYCDCRSYGINAERDCGSWIEWMIQVTSECLRVCRGAVVWVAASPTRKRTYWPACEGLMYEWWSRGGSAYRPCHYHRVGIPGSGGDQWFRGDTEYVMCFKRDGKLPWSDNTAMGAPPKYPPGGKPSHRLRNGSRTRSSGYVPPGKANPGNVIKLKAGGGHLGSGLAHENEAPFPEKLAEWFVLSLCPPGGVVLDPFCGSGTTAVVAQRHGRGFIASDLRMNQCELSQRRVEEGMQ